MNVLFIIKSEIQSHPDYSKLPIKFKSLTFYSVAYWILCKIVFKSVCRMSQ